MWDIESWSIPLGVPVTKELKGKGQYFIAKLIAENECHQDKCTTNKKFLMIVKDFSKIVMNSDLVNLPALLQMA